MKFSIYFLALVTTVILSSCTKVEGLTENSKAKIEVGEVTLNLQTILTDKGNLGNKEQIMNAAVCGEWPVMPNINIPRFFNVTFIDLEGNADPIVFEDVDSSSGDNTFEIPLKNYRVVVTNIVDASVDVTNIPRFRAEEDVDFRTVPRVNITVTPKQAWYLIDISDINVSTITVTESVDGSSPSPLPGPLFNFGTEWVGAFIGVFNYISSYEVYISFEDTRGISYNTTITNPVVGEVYRIQVCPESETGISVSSGSFETINDTTL